MQLAGDISEILFAQQMENDAVRVRIQFTNLRIRRISLFNHTFTNSKTIYVQTVCRQYSIYDLPCLTHSFSVTFSLSRTVLNCS